MSDPTAAERLRALPTTHRKDGALIAAYNRAMPALADLIEAAQQATDEGGTTYTLEELLNALAAVEAALEVGRE